MKYMGSKNRYTRHILPVIYQEVNILHYNCWFEPFVGGANVIDKVNGFSIKIGNDINPYLIKLLEAIRDGWVPPDYVTEEEYNNARIKSKEPINDNAHLIGFIGFCCSYSSKWFGGYARNIRKNLPEAEILNKTTRNYCAESKRNLLKQAPNLKNIEFRCNDYLTLDIPNNSVLYCDIPYSNTTNYRNKFNHEMFWKWCDEQIAKRHKVFVSEYAAPEGWRCIWEKQVNSSLTQDTGSKKAVERLFTK